MVDDSSHGLFADGDADQDGHVIKESLGVLLKTVKFKNVKLKFTACSNFPMFNELSEKMI